jgi:hypothetical protein
MRLIGKLIGGLIAGAVIAGLVAGAAWLLHKAGMSERAATGTVLGATLVISVIGLIRTWPQGRIGASLRRLELRMPDIFAAMGVSTDYAAFRFSMTVDRLVRAGMAEYGGWRRAYIADDAELQALLDRGANAEKRHNRAEDNAKHLAAEDVNGQQFTASLEELRTAAEELRAVRNELGERYPRANAQAEIS